jgi:hypothetical protein
LNAAKQNTRGTSTRPAAPSITSDPAPDKLGPFRDKNPGTAPAAFWNGRTQSTCSAADVDEARSGIALHLLRRRCMEFGYTTDDNPARIDILKPGERLCHRCFSLRRWKTPSR